MNTRTIEVWPQPFLTSCESNGTLNEQERETRKRKHLARQHVPQFDNWSIGFGLHTPNYTLRTIASLQVVSFELHNQSVPMLEKIKFNC